MSDTLSLGDRGLDLVLGGGLRRVRRVADKHATVLLVRGPGGAGKTLVGFHAACEIAKGHPEPIAYACVELLPTELEAQVRAWRPDLAHVKIRHRESVGVVAADDLVVEASLLDVDKGTAALGAGIEHFVDRLARAGRPPGVLVIDSLIDGYNIGTSASREFVDSVCKLATRWGIALVLLEECAPGTTSPWIFAADTVIELGLVSEDVDTSRSASFEHRLTVLKHRFGPSDAGPHRFTLDPGVPLRVLPRPGAWLEPWTMTLPGNVGVPRDPRRDEAGGKLQAPVHPDSNGTWLGLVVAVFGSVSARVYEVALGLQRRDEASLATLHVSFTVPLDDARKAPVTEVLGVAHPYLSAHRFLRVVLDELAQRGAVRRIVVADLRALRSFWNPAELRRAVGVLCQLARRMGIPIVLVETTVNRMEWLFSPTSGPTTSEAPGVDAAWGVDFADLSIEIHPNPLSAGTTGRVTDLRDGRTATLAPPSPAA